MWKECINYFHWAKNICCESHFEKVYAAFFKTANLAINSIIDSNTNRAMSFDDFLYWATNDLTFTVDIKAYWDCPFFFNQKQGVSDTLATIYIVTLTALNW